MKTELLYRIADIINSNSTKYHAVIPRVKRQNITQQGNHLVKWNVYGDDIDKVIEKIGRRDKEFAQRIDTCEPTLFDIEMIIRRASFQALKLKLVVTSYDIYLENN